MTYCIKCFKMQMHLTEIWVLNEHKKNFEKTNTGLFVCDSCLAQELTVLKDVYPYALTRSSDCAIVFNKLIQIRLFGKNFWVEAPYDKTHPAYALSDFVQRKKYCEAKGNDLEDYTPPSKKEACKWSGFSTGNINKYGLLKKGVLNE